MKRLIERLGISVNHLKCLDEVFSSNSAEYQRINSILESEAFKSVYTEISRQLYGGGKQFRGRLKLYRQMILGDLIQYILTGRAYYYASSEENLKNFFKLLFYCVNQLLIYDTITVNPEIRKKYIELLEQQIDLNILYEKEGDRELAQELKNSDAVIWTEQYKKYEDFLDSILPKTLGSPKELVVFALLIRGKSGIIVPLLLLQRVFGKLDPIAPPDFLLIKRNKDIFGIEVGYKKELQSRKFSLRTSIPTFAVDLKNNMHNRCHKCGENILYCDPVIEAFANDTLDQRIRNAGGKFLCNDCPLFDNGNCKFSNYYGERDGTTFFGTDDKGSKHYHIACVKNDSYTYRRNPKAISDHLESCFAQIPEIQGIENL